MKGVIYLLVLVAIVCIRVLPQPIAIAKSDVAHFMDKNQNIGYEKPVVENELSERFEEALIEIYDPVLDCYYDLAAFNQLPQETLVHFKGIGEVLSQAIIDHRKQFGDFTSFYELIEVRGIGTKKLEDILENSK